MKFKNQKKIKTNQKILKPIAVIDWGIGGLSVLMPLRKKYPEVNFIYFSDSGFTPYGKTTEKKLLQRLQKLIRLFKSKNIFTVIIACNAASTVLPQLRKAFPSMNLVGMLEAGAKIISLKKSSSTLVLGGQRTIESNYFQNEFKNSRHAVQAIVAQPLSGLIEKGQQGSKLFISELHKIKHSCYIKPNQVLLACTHYPVAATHFKKIFKPAKILNPALQLVTNLNLKKNHKTDSFKKVKNENKKNLLQFNSKKGLVLYLTTGSVTESNTAALKAFKIKTVRFQSYPLSLTLRNES